MAAVLRPVAGVGRERREPGSRHGAPRAAPPREPSCPARPRSNPSETTSVTRPGRPRRSAARQEGAARRRSGCRRPSPRPGRRALQGLLAVAEPQARVTRVSRVPKVKTRSAAPSHQRVGEAQMRVGALPSWSRRRRSGAGCAGARACGGGAAAHDASPSCRSARARSARRSTAGRGGPAHRGSRAAAAAGRRRGRTGASVPPRPPRAAALRQRASRPLAGLVDPASPRTPRSPSASATISSPGSPLHRSRHRGSGGRTGRRKPPRSGGGASVAARRGGCRPCPRPEQVDRGGEAGRLLRATRKPFDRSRAAKPTKGAPGGRRAPRHAAPRHDASRRGVHVGHVLLVLDRRAERPAEGSGQGAAAVRSAGSRPPPIDASADAVRFSERAPASHPTAATTARAGALGDRRGGHHDDMRLPAPAPGRRCSGRRSGGAAPRAARACGSRSAPRRAFRRRSVPRSGSRSRSRTGTRAGTPRTRGRSGRSRR
jgi:hypothetical protein